MDGSVDSPFQRALLHSAVALAPRACAIYQQVTSLPSLPKIARRCSAAICVAPAGL